MAAEKTGRGARLIEFDPLYCDVIVRRYKAFTGKRARLADTGETFEEVGEDRKPEMAVGPNKNAFDEGN